MKFRKVRMNCKRKILDFVVVVSAIALLLLLSVSVSAQTSTGQISGTVFDATGAVIPAATVRIIGAETGEVARTTESNQVGRFSAPLLDPGRYNVEVESSGFKRFVQSGVQLRVDDVLNLRLTLEPGVVTESITVSAAAVLLEETTHSVGQVIEETTIQRLPLNARNYLDLGNLSAGTVPNTRSRDKTYSAYGNRGLQNAFLLDGARNINYLRGLDNRQRDAMRPSLEAIAEFKVQTSNFSAEYGASAGAVVNVVTKSGTNDYHGSVFEFLRNNNLDARDFFFPADDEEPLFIQHQFGGALGGPVVKNKAWWFGSYQRTHISEGATLSGTVPSPEQKQGVFTDPLFDPFTTRKNPGGSGHVRDPFPNSTIPASRFDAIGKDMASRYPDPTNNRVSGNFVQAPIQGTRINNATFRGDVQLTGSDSMFGRFSFNLGDFEGSPALPEPAGTGVIREAPSYSVGYGYTRTFSPTLVNEFRLAWNRVGVDQDGTLPRNEIIPGSLDPDVTSSIPTFGVTGFTTLGGQPSGMGNIPLLKFSGVWNVSDNISIIRGNHTLKFGYDYQQIRAKTSATLAGRGSFTFRGVFTQDPQSRPGTGNGLADLLLGIPDQINTGTRSVARERAHNMYGYLQDDWRVTPRLTLNLGLRYELTRPFIELDNRMGNFIMERDDPDFGELILAGDSRKPRSLLETDYNNIAPRFGFAYRTPWQGIVIRGGYGIFCGQDEGTGVNRRMTNNPPFFGFGAVQKRSDRLFSSSTIILSEATIPRPDPVAPEDFVLEPTATARLRSWTQRFTMPYVQQWTLNIQKELPGNMLWEVSYVGNHGLKLWASYEGNQPEPGPGSINPRRPLAEYTRARIFRSEPWSSSTYHGVSTRLEKRFSRGMSFLLGYTFGRSIDTASEFGVCDGCGPSADANVPNTRNLGAQKAASNHNIPHRFVFSGIYELPWGAGRRYLNSGALKHIIGGWNISGIISISDGIPFTPTLSQDNVNTGESARPDRIRDGKLDNATPDRYYDIDAFVFPPEYVFGNSGRNILEGPGTNMVNFALHRNFPVPINEASRVEFRFEAFNFFNRPHFGLPGLSIGTSSAGVINGTSQTNRQLQFGLKLIF